MLAIFMLGVSGADWTATCMDVQADNCEGFQDWELDDVALRWLHVFRFFVRYKMVLRQDELIFLCSVRRREQSLRSLHKTLLQFSRISLQAYAHL